MKNSSKKKFPEKNNNDYKKNSDFGHSSKNTNRLEKNVRFLNNSSKNKNVGNLKKNDIILLDSFSSITNSNFLFWSSKPPVKALAVLRHYSSAALSACLSFSSCHDNRDLPSCIQNNRENCYFAR